MRRRLCFAVEFVFAVFFFSFQSSLQTSHLCLGSAALRCLFPRREQPSQLRRHVLVLGVVLRGRAGPAPGHFFGLGIAFDER